MPFSSSISVDPPSPNFEDQDENLKNKTTASTQIPSTVLLPASPTQPRPTASTTPPSSPSQPFVPGNLPGTFPGLRNSSQHTPFPRGSINPANAMWALRGSVGEYRGVSFSTNRTGAPPLHQVPANMGVYIENPAPGSKRAVNAIPYRAPPNTNTLAPTPYISLSRMSAPDSTTQRHYLMLPDGTRTGQFSMQL